MSDTTSAPDEQRIRERAYDLWEKEGRPDGRDVEFWERARTLMNTEQKASAMGTGKGATPQAHRIDSASADSFPASDPPSHTATKGPSS